MRKFIPSSLLVVIAMSTAVFFKIDAEGPQCGVTWIWFQVNPAVNKSCNQLTVSDIQWIQDSNGNNIPDEVVSGTEASSPYGCEDVNQYCCGVGYHFSSSSTTNQVERVQIGDAFYWRPIANQVANFQCSISKSAN